MKDGTTSNNRSYFRHEYGDDGETLAEQFLLKKGFRLITQNYSSRWGEIDLVMEDGPTLVFVEVRRRSNTAFGYPEESISPKKIQRVIKTALAYLMNTGTSHKMVRFDVVSIVPGRIRHIPDAFSANDLYFY